MPNIFSQLKIQNILDRDPDKFEPRPRRAWAIIFFAGVVLIALSLSANLYAYFSVRADSSFKSDGGSSEKSEVKLNRKDLAEIIAALLAKNLQFQNLLASSPKIADPSLGAGSQDHPADQGAVSPKKKTSSKKSPVTPVPVE